MQQRDRGVQPAPLAPRQLGRPPVEQCVETERVGDLVDALPLLGAAHSREAGEEAQVVANAERRVHARFLRREPDEPPGALRRAHHVDPADVNGPGVGATQPGDDRDQRRLARPVRTEQPEDRPGLDLEVDARPARPWSPYDLCRPRIASAGAARGRVLLVPRFRAVSCIPVSIHDLDQYIKGVVVTIEPLTPERRRAMTREHLLEAAAVVFARNGYHGASLDEVAAAAGFTKGAVYSNFKSKEDLFLALIDHRIEMQRRPKFNALDGPRRHGARR